MAFPGKGFSSAICLRASDKILVGCAYKFRVALGRTYTSAMVVCVSDLQENNCPMPSLAVIDSKPKEIQIGDVNHAEKWYNNPPNNRNYPHPHRSHIGPLPSHSHLQWIPKNQNPKSCVGTENCGRSVASRIDASGGGSCENLDRFLAFTTPLIPAQHLPKTGMKERRTGEVGFQPFFSLSDLWESFNEWSAYGAGVPVALNGNGNDFVVQYYVPYLSAIQLYSDSTIQRRVPREDSDESDGDYRDTSSEASSDSEAERVLKYERSLQYRNWQANNPHPGVNSKSDKVAQNYQPRASQECFPSGDREGSNMPGCLLFEYFERATPCSREPLTDKIMDLARDFPQLITLRSIDLLPTSWISVAWYPIYKIPTGPTLHEKAPSFLTFHSLSPPLRAGGTAHFGHREGMQSLSCTRSVITWESIKISLPVFGLASYKSKGAIWTSPGSYEQQQAHLLFRSADEWLKVLGVEHPDFEFFLSHSSMHQR